MLTLKSLSIINYGSHVNSYIDFTNLSTLAILGEHENNSDKSNGSGKSTILDSILFSLTGKGKFNKMEDVIRDNNGKYFGNTKVELELKNEKNIYKIVREIKISKKNKIEGNVDYYINDVIKSSNTNAQIEIDKLIVSGKIFSASFFFPEGGTDIFTSAKPSDRRNYINNIFEEKLKEYLSYIDFSKEKEKEYLKETNNLEIKIDNLNEELLIYKEKKFNEFDLENAIKEKDEIKKEQNKIKEIYGDSKSNFIKKEKELKKQIEFLNKVVNEFNNDIKDIDIEILETQFNNLKFYPNIIKEKESELILKEKLQKEIKELELKRSPLQKDLKNLESIKTPLCPMCKQVINIENSRKLIIDYENKINILTVEIEEKYRVLKEKNNFINELMEKEKEHNCGLKQKEILELKIENKNKELKDLTFNKEKDEKTLLELQKELNKLPKWDKEIEDKISELNYKYNKIIEYIDLAKQEKTKQEMNIKNIKRIETKLDELRKEKEKAIKKRSLYSDMYNIFNISHQKASLFFLKSIENETNKILQDINSDYRFLIEEKNNKRKDIELYFYVRDSKRSYQRLSLGEKRILDVSCRLAISNVLNLINPNKIGFICIDEIFSNLDKHNQRELALFIQKLQKTKYKQIIILDHSPYLKDFFDKVLVVELKDKFSYIKE